MKKTYNSEKTYYYSLRYAKWINGQGWETSPETIEESPAYISSQEQLDAAIEKVNGITAENYREISEMVPIEWNEIEMCDGEEVNAQWTICLMVTEEEQKCDWIIETGWEDEEIAKKSFWESDVLLSSGVDEEQ